MNLNDLAVAPAMSRCSRCTLSPLACMCDMPAARKQEFKHFDFARLAEADAEIVRRYIGSLERRPDVIIDSHETGEYLWRWHMFTKNGEAGSYLHIQTTSDPERPLHCHPWDNMSCILAGGFDEIIQQQPPHGDVFVQSVRAGGTVFRRAEFAHRLILPDDIPYTISLFSFGRKRREWGFWIDGIWYTHQDCITNDPHTQQVFFKDPITGVANG